MWADRGSRQSRGYGAVWEKLRVRVLKRDDYLCKVCLAKGRITAATQVDHIKQKAKGGTDDLDNLQSICDPCHADKTYRENGRIARPVIGLDGWPID